MRFPRFLTALLLLAALLPLARGGLAQGADPAAQTVSRLRAGDLVRQAEVLTDQGKPAEAARRWEEAAALHPAYQYDRLQNAAWAWMDAGEGKEALRVLTAAPLNRTQSLELAVAYFLAGDRAKSLEQVQRVTASADYDAVKAEVEAGIGEAPGSFTRRLALAHLLLMAAQPGRAYRIATELVREQPTDPAAHLYRADAAERLGRYEEAARERGLHAEGAPGSARAFITRAATFEFQGQPEKAVAELEAGRKKHPTNEYVLAALANLEGRLGHADRVAALLREAMAAPLVAPYGPPSMTWNAATAALTRLERWETLESIAGETARRWPGYYAAVYERARALVMLGRFGDAVRAVEAFPTPSGAPRPAGQPVRVNVIAPSWLFYLAAGEKEKAQAVLGGVAPLGFSPTLAEETSLRAWMAPTGPEREDLLVRSALGPIPFPIFRSDNTYEYIYGEGQREAHLRLWEAVRKQYPDCFPAPYFEALTLARVSRERAFGLLQEAVKMAPTWALPHRMLAEYHRAVEDGRRAAAEGERANELLGNYNPNSFEAQPSAPLLAAREEYRAVVALARAGKWEEAAPKLAAISQYPFREAAARLRVAVLVADGKLPEAQTALEQSTRGNPFPLGFPFNRSYYDFFPPLTPALAPHRKLTDYSFAEAALALAMGVAGSGLGSSTSSMGKADTLEVLLQDAYRKAPEDRRTRAYLGIWLLRSDESWPEGAPEKTDPERPRHGRELLESLLKEMPGDPAAPIALGREGEALERNPDNGLLLGQVAYEGSMADVRIRALTALKTRDPLDASARERLWEEYRRLGEEERAVEEAQDMQEGPLLFPPDPDGKARAEEQVLRMRRRGLMLEGVLHHRRGNTLRARVAFDRLLMAPGGAEERFGYGAHFWTGLLRLEMGDLARAETPLREAAEEEPENTLPPLLLAWLYRRTGREQEMWRRLTTVDLARNPYNPVSTRRESQVAPEDVDLRTDLERIVVAFPDCWAARLALAIQGWQRQEFAGRKGADAVHWARIAFDEAARQAPAWSGPAAFLAARAESNGYFAAEARRLHRAEAVVLQRPAEEKPRPPLVPPLRIAWRKASYGPVAGDKRDLFVRSGEQLQRLSRSNGAELERVSGLSDQNGPLGLSRDLVLSLNGNVAAAHAREGLALRWTTPLPPPEKPLSPVLNGSTHFGPVIDETCCVWVDSLGEASCLRLADGSLAWSVKLGSAPSAPPLLAGDLCLIPLEDGTLRRLKRGDGAALPPVTTPPVGEKQGVVRRWAVSGGQLFTLLGLAGQPGYGPRVLARWEAGAEKPDWTADLPDPNQSEIVAAPSGLVVFAPEPRQIRLLDADNGKVLKTIDMPGNSAFRYLTTLEDRVVLASARQMAVVDLRDGKLALQALPGFDMNLASGAVRLGDLLLLTGSNYLVALSGAEAPAETGDGARPARLRSSVSGLPFPARKLTPARG
jgi:Tfp pilus assembly protein PilF